MREARDYVQGRRSSEQLRKMLFQESLYDSGGERGLRVFFPSVTAACRQDCAAQLRAHLEDVEGMKFHEAHSLQWGCCVFQKSISPGYKRVRGDEVLKPAKCISHTSHLI